MVYPTIWIASLEDESETVVAILFTMRDYSYSSGPDVTYKVPSLSQQLAEADSQIDVEVGICTPFASWVAGEVQWIDIAGTTSIQTSSFPSITS